MRRLVVVLVLAAVGRLAAQESMERAALPGIRFEGAEATIPMDFSAGRPTVQVYLNGKGPYPFVFDTGAPGSVLDADLLQEIGVEASGEVQVGDPSGRNQTTAKRATIDSVRVGGVTISRMDVTVLPMRGRFQSKFLGVLGFPYFASELLELDYPHSLILVRHGRLSTDVAGVVPYRTVHGLIEFDVQVGEKTVPFHLDSGSSGGFTVSPEIASGLAWAAKPESVATAKTVNNEYTVRRGTMNGTVRFAGLTFDNPEVGFFELVRGGNIGQGILRQLVVTIDQENQLLQFSKPKS
jgi:Aspartyl protease